MPLESLGLESLSLLDPKVAESVRRHLTRAANDARDRPEDKKARVVTLKVLVAPVFRDGLCEEVNLQCKVASSVPDHTSKVYNLAVRPSGAMLFNPDSPDAVGQTTFMDQDEE